MGSRPYCEEEENYRMNSKWQVICLICDETMNPLKGKEFFVGQPDHSRVCNGCKEVIRELKQ